MDKPRIKPLIWYGKPEGQDVRIGRCGDIAYSVRFDMDNWGYTRKGESGLIISYKGGPIFQCEADAIDGADVDHEARILAALEPVTDAPDWEGFGRDLLESWPVRDVDGAELFDAALRNRLIREIPGGYDPEQHIDADGICPEPGDPWYEYAFRAQGDTQ